MTSNDTYLLTDLLACLCAYLPTCPANDLPTDLLTHLPTCLLT